MKKYYIIYEGETLIYFGKGGEVFVPESMSVAYFDDADDARAFIREKGLKKDL